jgi:DNA-binding MarR family transcriptional regulator
MKADLALDNQLCFALYAASRLTSSAYRRCLDPLGITYPQYLVLLALWEADGVTVTDLGRRLYLDSGTLSPLLRRMEAQGLVRRRREQQDARLVTVHLSAEGAALRDHGEDIQRCLAPLGLLTPDEARTLRDLARRLINASPSTDPAHDAAPDARKDTR